MGNIVRTRIAPIGNSQGIRIPKLLLEQVGWAEDEDVELEVQSNRIVIRPSSEARQGWDAAFKAMAAQGDDALLDEEAASTSEFDEDEWTWS